MNNKKVISNKQLPSKLPLWPTLICWLFLDHFNMPGWIWGALGILFLFFWFISIYLLFKQEQTEIKL